MNANFTKLIDRAGFIKFTAEEDPEMPVDWSCDYTEELEKFAQLIVKECMDIVSEIPIIDNGYPHPAWKIKQHFGIKE
jgi:hypothetical protein